MMAKHNTDEAGVRQIMADRQKQSMASPKRKEHPHRGGFNVPGVAKEAVNKRWKEYNKTDEDQLAKDQV